MKKGVIAVLVSSAIFLTMAASLTNAQTATADSTGSGARTQTSRGEGLSVNLPAKQTANHYVRPSANQRFRRYLNKTVGTGLIGVGIGAGIGQIAEVPPEWKRNGNGFGRRLASGFGENAIQETVAYGLEEAFKLDSKFYKSKKRDVGSRLRNGLISGVTARTPSGKRVFNPSPIIGSYTANIISTETWYPKRYNYKDGLRQGTQNIGFTIGFGLLNEFLFNRK